MQEAHDTPAFARRRCEVEAGPVVEVAYRDGAAADQTWRRPLRISRSLPEADTPITAAELAGLEALCALVGDEPWVEAEHPLTGEPCVLIDDDEREFMPAEIVSAFGQDNAALPAFVMQAHNLMPRLIAEIRRGRSAT